jgi:predicted nucleic acid-binding protein
MSAEIFLDSNVLVYALDPAAPAVKRARANEIVQGSLAQADACISVQVAQEVLHVATQKFAVPLRPDQALDYLDTVLAPLCTIWTGLSLLKAAIELRETTRFHFYDCLIIAAALEAHCRVLLSEDLQHGRRLGGLRIENPFL